MTLSIDENLSREDLCDKIIYLEQYNKNLIAEIDTLKSQLHVESSVKGWLFKERYATKILDSLPDMLTVLTHSGQLVALVSSEKTNHVGEPGEQIVGRNISTIVPAEAYKNIKENLDRVVATNEVSMSTHDLIFDGLIHHYENRIFPLDKEHVLCMCRDITESVHAKQGMELAMHKMKSAEDIASLSHWYFHVNSQRLDMPGIIPIFSKGEDKRTHCQLSEYLEYVHPEDSGNLVFYAPEGCISDKFHEHRLLVDGKITYLHSRIIYIHDNDGEKIIEGYVQDVTNIVDRRHELEIVKYAVNNVGEEIYACSMSGEIVFANNQFTSHYNLIEPISKRKIYEIEDAGFTYSKWIQLVENIRKNGGSFKYNITQAEKRMEIMSYVIKNELDDDVIWLFSRDITMRVKQDNKIKELNCIMDAILNNIPVYLFVKDPAADFRYLYWNKAFAEHAKIPVENVIGRTDFEIFPNQIDANKFRQDDIALLNSGTKVEFLEEYITAEGETRIVNTLKTLIPSEGDSPWLIGVSWDITDLKKTEQDLIDAREKAVQSDKLKSAFLANMSHEIRTPLNAIVGFSKLITETEDYSEKQQYSDIIDNNADLLLQLINDILDISKIEAGTIEFIEKQVNIGDLCRDVYEVHHHRVHPGVEFVYDNNNLDVVICSDCNRLLQVLTNLITNAIKFTDSGEIHFGFKRENKLIEFYVSDTGLGMAQEHIENIFNRFVKLNSFAQGTGLGLSICRMIVGRMGGTIWVDSVLDQGSTFHFTIPYDIAHSGCESSMFETITSKSEPVTDNVCGSLAQQKTILIAEDIDSNFLLLKASIGKTYRLIRAHNGIEVIDKFRSEAPDLILMDIKMPKMDGIEATKKIRELSNSVPIIALTAFAFESDKQMALDSGCNDFITKPVSFRTLEKLLQNYI